MKKLMKASEVKVGDKISTKKHGTSYGPAKVTDVLQLGSVILELNGRTEVVLDYSHLVVKY